MALSNINEPRREITESVIGLGLFGVFLLADYAFAMMMNGIFGDGSLGDMMAYMVLGILLSGWLGLILLVTHAIGEAACNAFQARGIYLRPRR